MTAAAAYHQGATLQLLVNSEFFIWEILLTHQLGSVPYPSYPALCHDDTTFHGGTDYGEHHATSVKNMRSELRIRRATHSSIFAIESWEVVWARAQSCGHEWQHIRYRALVACLGAYSELRVCGGPGGGVLGEVLKDVSGKVLGRDLGQILVAVFGDVFAEVHWEVLDVVFGDVFEEALGTVLGEDLGEVAVDVEGAVL